MSALALPISKLWSSYRLYGAAETLCRVLHQSRVVSVKHSFDVFYKTLPSSRDVEALRREARAACAGGALTLREVAASELPRLRFAEGMEYAADRTITDDMRKQFSKGLRYFAAFDGETVIAVNGFHPSTAHLDYIRKPVVALSAGVAYINGAFTAPAYRRRKVGSALRAYMLAALVTEGFRYVVLTTFTDELGAVRWHLANDFRRWGRVTYLRWGRRDLWWTRLTREGQRHPALLNLGSDTVSDPVSDPGSP